LEKQHDTSCLPPLVKTIKKKLVKTIHKNKKPLSSVSTALGKFVQSLLKEVLEKNVIKNIASLK
jgi:2-hydroxy-3-keto-5-methylthiopentenyl-1-phosphate phosphatase